MNETHPSRKAHTMRINSKTDMLQSSLHTSSHVRRRAKSFHVSLVFATCMGFTLAGCVGLRFVDTERKIAWDPTQSVRSLNSHAPTIVAPDLSGPSSQTITLDSATSSAEYKLKPLPVISGATMQAANSRTLRCWQDGRLVVDHAVNPIPKTTANVFTIQDKETGNDIYTFDLKNALCIVS